jgi:hypothetical protein
MISNVKSIIATIPIPDSSLVSPFLFFNIVRFNMVEQAGDSLGSALFKFYFSGISKVFIKNTLTRKVNNDIHIVEGITVNIGFTWIPIIDILRIRFTFLSGE